MNDTNTPENPAIEQSAALALQTPDDGAPKYDVYTGMIKSYSALTDVINPKAIECDFGDIRELDSCMLEQAVLLNNLTIKMFDSVYYDDGSINQAKLFNALKVQQAFRESYRSANMAMTHRYIAGATRD